MRCIGCRVNNSARWLIYTCEPYRAGGSNSNTEPRPAAEEEHIEIPMKRSACVICKKAAQHERGRKRRALEDISPNEGLDRHVRRARVGCKACGVNLCSRRGCWETFHEGGSSR